MHDLTKPFRLIRGVGGNYWVHNPELKVFQVQAPGVFRKQDRKPLPGDLILCEETNDELIPLRMVKILPRKNILPRPSIVNLDQIWLIIPLSEPEPDLWVLDKMLVIAHETDIESKIIFTKEDLMTDEFAHVPDIYSSLEYDVVLTHPQKEGTLQELRESLKHKFVALAGPSGAGKSTLLNILLGQELMETAEISDKLGRGKHTTRHVELFPFGDSYVADTPGFSSLDLFQAGTTEETLVQAYPEIWALQNDCRFLSCKHLTEPSCAVRNSDTIDRGRLERYQEFRKQLENSKAYERKENR